MQEGEIIEEDWSHIPNTANHNDVLSNGDTNANLFSYYQTQTFSLSCDTADPVIMRLCCLESLTPLDMLDLSNGVADATGSRVWLGAQWFMKCMVICPLSSTFDSSLDPTAMPASNMHGSSQLKPYFQLLQLRKDLFHEKKVLELGAGTGASLISLGLASMVTTSGRHGTDITQESVVPSLLTLTDNDPVALSLCQINCDANLSCTGIDYQVVKLEWGKEHLDNVTKTSTTGTIIEESSQDTIIATDVLYDLSALKPLMETASLLLKTGGHFVLSHIPRASVEDCELKDITQALEQEIRREASKHNLVLLCPASLDGEEANGIVVDVLEGLIEPSDYAIRPSTWMKCWPDYANVAGTCDNNTVTDSSYLECVELESIGASILIFVKL